MSCVDCFSGSVHRGIPSGKVTKIHGLDVYVSDPMDTRGIRGIIVVIPDALGWKFVNNRILADHYAAKGNYKVYLPEFMGGWAAPEWMIDSVRILTNPKTAVLTRLYHILWALYGFIPFIIANRPAASYPRVKKFFSDLRHNGEGSTLPVGAAGFCWGGKHTLLLAADQTLCNGEPLFDAGFTGHPSLLSFPDDIERIKRPVSFALAAKDPTLSMDKADTIKRIVEAKPAEQRGEVKIYPDCSHGFCVRADMEFVEVANQAAKAEEQCIEWFDKQFGFMPSKGI